VPTKKRKKTTSSSTTVILGGLLALATVLIFLAIKRFGEKMAADEKERESKRFEEEEEKKKKKAKQDAEKYAEALEREEEAKREEEKNVYIPPDVPADRELSDPTILLTPPPTRTTTTPTTTTTIKSPPVSPVPPKLPAPPRQQVNPFDPIGSGGFGYRPAISPEFKQGRSSVPFGNTANATLMADLPKSVSPAEATALVKKLCPPPYVAEPVGPGGKQNCYKQCEAGFSSYLVLPNADSELFLTDEYVSTDAKRTVPVDGKVMTQMVDANGKATFVVSLEGYYVCRANCPMKLDGQGRPTGETTETMQGNMCQRTSYEREMGRGPDAVKCGWTVSYDGKNFDRACKDEWGPDCMHGRQDTNRGGTTNNELCTQWYGPSNSRTELLFTPIACGGEYELLPAHEAAFFTRNMTGSIAGFNLLTPIPGFANGRTAFGMRCYKRCAPWRTEIPWGLLERHLCSQPCPMNTKEVPTNPNACLKEGYKRPIVLADLNREIRDLVRPPITKTTTPTTTTTTTTTPPTTTTTPATTTTTTTTPPTTNV
jgi:hypothetical protein